jgi:hypothetical protein
MATRASSLFVANDTDAHFRAWAKEVHDMLTAAGWVNTADTGQINLATVVKPAAASTSQGYEIWRMADSLQSLYPVFMKIEYGSAASSSNNPAIWITVGTASDGAGTLTGIVSTRKTNGCAAYTTAAKNAFMSGSTSRFAVALGADNQDANSALYFGVERTKQTDGTDSNEGVHVVSLSSRDPGIVGELFWHMAIPFSGSIPNVESFGSGDMPTNSSQTTAILGSDTFVFSIRPSLFYPRNPCMNWLVYYNADFTREVSVTLDMYGANHVYMPMGNHASVSSSNPSSLTPTYLTLARIMMRYE